MDTIQPEATPPPAGFASLADAKKAIKLLIPPLTEEQRRAFVATLGESPRPKQLAFRLLALLVTNQAGRGEKLLSLLQPELTGVLAGAPDQTAEEMAARSGEDVKVWVRDQFPAIATREEGVLYLETEQHLWTLYQILRWSTDTAKFMVALTAYTDELESLTIAGGGGKKRRQAKRSAGFSSLITTLFKRVPSRPSAIESLLENLRLCRACAAASAELQEELETVRARNERLKADLESERATLAAEQTAHGEARGRETTVAAQLAQAQSEMAELDEALKIQAGAHATERIGAVADAISTLRRKLLPELENIRLYADRAEPNAGAIVRKAEELTKFLKDFQGT